MRYIADLREESSVGDIYLCKKKQELMTKAGKPYFSLQLQDKTGILDAKVWNTSSNGIEDFDTMDYIYVTGRVNSFQGGLQLSIERIRKSQEGEYNPAEYMPTTKKDIEQMYQEIIEIVNSIKEPYLLQLTKSFFTEDLDFIKAFKFHSAAKTVHHGFMGGLLEHTLGVAKMSEYFATNYKIINRDLLITAALFHDIGKLDELSSFPENDYTEDGQLLGHIFIGAEKIGIKVREIAGFPPKLANDLRHCILAHHGELEYGSPKKPALVEAMALNFADNADAKLQTMTELFDAADERVEWLGYNRLFETNIKRTSK
jgi:3'-5' exoribonuclease